VAPIADLAGVVRSGLPGDHLSAFAQVTGRSWAAALSAGSASTGYISLLEVGYAIHELTFGLFFLIIVCIPLRRGERWAWFACWPVLIADVGYSITFGRYDSNLLRQSLIADVAVPILLVAQASRFFRDRSGRHAVPSVPPLRTS